MQPFLDVEAFAKMLEKTSFAFCAVCVGQCVLEQGLQASIYTHGNP